MDSLLANSVGHFNLYIYIKVTYKLNIKYRFYLTIQ